MKMQSKLSTLLGGLVLAAFVAGPAAADPAKTLPPLGAGEARVFVFRPLEPYESVRPVRFFIDGQLLVRSENGTFTYYDVPAGQHVFEVKAEVQFTEQTLPLTLPPHGVVYLTIASGQNPGNIYNEGSIHILRLVDPSLGQAEVASLRQLDTVNVRQAAQGAGK